MRKQLFLILIISLCAMSSFGQDIIVKKSGDEIKSKILEITVESIKYKEFDFQDGPIRNILISDVFMIIYENGKRENFSTIENNNNNSSEFGDSIRSKVKRFKELNHRKNYFTASIGYGDSYGGLGASFQYVFPWDFRFGFHAGVGYFPANGGTLMVGGGFKFYLVGNWYFDTQFGAFGNVHYVAYNGTGTAINYESTSNIWGPTIMTGYDIFFSEHIGINFGSGISIAVESGDGGPQDGQVYYAIDTGLIIRF